MNSILDNTDVAEDPNKDYLNELVGEGKKYKDPNELAKAYFHADRTINIMKPRMDEMRQDYLKVYEESQVKGELANLISELRDMKQPASSNNPANEVREQPVINVDEIRTSILSEVPKAITAYETQRRETENANLVVSKLKERYGNNFSTAVREQIEDLGLTEDEFNTLARRSPKTILKTLGVDEKRDTTSVPRGQSSWGSKMEPKKTWSYYQALKRENPNLYRDPKTTNEMIEAAEQLGDAFYDGDFNRL